jgi:hypothetical protein
MRIIPANLLSADYKSLDIVPEEGMKTSGEITQKPIAIFFALTPVYKDRICWHGSNQ